MLMDMMQVRCVRVAVLRCLMRMPVTVCAYRHRGMDVVMVSVIMGMFMLKRLMLVLVFMPFCNVQDDTRQHQRRAA